MRQRTWQLTFMIHRDEPQLDVLLEALEEVGLVERDDRLVYVRATASSPGKARRAAEDVLRQHFGWTAFLRLA